MPVHYFGKHASVLTLKKFFQQNPRGTTELGIIVSNDYLDYQELRRRVVIDENRSFAAEKL
jgi:hypothetical protein